MSTPFFPHIDSYLLTVIQSAADFNCTELKLVVGHPPLWQCNGEYSPIWGDAEPLTEPQLQELAASFLGNQGMDDLQATGQVQAPHSTEAGTYTGVVVQTANGLDISFAMNAVAEVAQPAAEEAETPALSTGEKSGCQTQNSGFPPVGMTLLIFLLGYSFSRRERTSPSCSRNATRNS